VATLLLVACITRYFLTVAVGETAQFLQGTVAATGRDRVDWGVLFVDPSLSLVGGSVCLFCLSVCRFVCLFCVVQIPVSAALGTANISCNYVVESSSL
jgi:hypothetical protein